ncbi:hypothetical protein EMIHUDRAFT_223971 [Emiliania huxleyi CCMP1516]|uniref:C2H2-type domain-containing protein n=2 Tax=Emiliania huxleyi TaxID=2903 RepID=A0A0D3KSY2_EMIH1|nr:hypothetical protein EMIHUDRAFT_223971 [Emiliania huxleyi CCMP1516]EOD38867.1 hypothetical protein EMIHUDRAFT_223971 [Emiliania huxleyi CCMP1516]|eukprot:XP_005791296.1 hypothetical protein EMIHUDRAFT_223971 [Emiliania huxleyi CCMP1516]
MCDPFPAEEAATSTIFRCKFPGCLRSYGSTDAARKHARKTHPDWLKLADAAAAKRVRGGPSTKSSFYCAREEAPLLSPSSAVPNGGLLRLDSALERLGGSLAATAAFGDAAAPPSSAPGLPSSLPSLFSLGDGVGWGAGAPAWAWPEPLPPLLGGVGSDSPGGWDALPADRVADSLSLPALKAHAAADLARLAELKLLSPLKASPFKRPKLGAAGDGFAFPPAPALGGCDGGSLAALLAESYGGGLGGETPGGGRLGGGGACGGLLQLRECGAISGVEIGTLRVEIGTTSRPSSPFDVLGALLSV